METILIRKYPNRRLYRVATSSFVQNGAVLEMVRAGADVQIVEHKTNTDITAYALLSMILQTSSIPLPMSVEEIHAFLRKTSAS